MPRGFFRFPSTPHVAWLSDAPLRDDKLMGDDAVAELLAGEVVVEEKVDGANVGLSIDGEGGLRVQNRGGYLAEAACHPQFRPLWTWLATRREALVDALADDLMLFGEWCYARHSIRYDRLPDWFLGFDVYDLAAGRFWAAERRDGLLASLGLHAVPRVAAGRWSLDDLPGLLGPSALGDVPMEGVYLRRDAGEWLELRAKLVRPEFAQTIEDHWSRRRIEPNRLGWAA